MTKTEAEFLFKYLSISVEELADLGDVERWPDTPENRDLATKVAMYQWKCKTEEEWKAHKSYWPVTDDIESNEITVASCDYLQYLTAKFAEEYGLKPAGEL